MKINTFFKKKKLYTPHLSEGLKFKNVQKKNKTGSTPNDGMTGEKLNPSYIADGNAKWCGHCKMVWQFPFFFEWGSGSGGDILKKNQKQKLNMQQPRK